MLALPILLALSLAQTAPLAAEEPMTAPDMEIAKKCAMPGMKRNAQCEAFKKAHAAALATMPVMSSDGPELHGGPATPAGKSAAATPN